MCLYICDSNQNDYILNKKHKPTEWSVFYSINVFSGIRCPIFPLPVILGALIAPVRTVNIQRVVEPPETPF